MTIMKAAQPFILIVQQMGRTKRATSGFTLRFVSALATVTGSVAVELLVKKAIITVVGRDTVGIIAKTSAYLAKNKINILDISQTVVQDYFNMMMIVDIAACRKNFESIAADLAVLGQDMGLEIRCQNSEIFEKMHRV